MGKHYYVPSNLPQTIVGYVPIAKYAELEAEVARLHKRVRLEDYEAAVIEANSLREEVARLREALEKISEPIKYFMQKAKDGNLELDPHYVLQLADNAGWLRDIAKAALEASDK